MVVRVVARVIPTEISEHVVDCLGRHVVAGAQQPAAIADRQAAADLSPNQEDVNAGATFSVATATYALNWYLTQDWVKDWLKEVFKENSKGRDLDEQEQELAQG